MSQVIYKVVSEEVWQKAQEDGVFAGAEIDLADGYIHFSTAEQVVETVALHFAGREGLVLVAVSVDALGDDLKWEASRKQQLFPHLYNELPMSAVRKTNPLPIGPDGNHVFPDLAQDG